MDVPRKDFDMIAKALRCAAEIKRRQVKLLRGHIEDLGPLIRETLPDIERAANRLEYLAEEFEREYHGKR